MSNKDLALQAFAETFRRIGVESSDPTESAHFRNLSRQAKAQAEQKIPEPLDVCDYVELLTVRVAELLAEIDDPEERREAMRELERAGLDRGFSLGGLRWGTPSEFAQDFFAPSHDFIAGMVAVEGMKDDPTTYEIIEEVISDIRPRPY